MAQQLTPLVKPWYSEVPRNARFAKTFGAAVMISTVLIFGVWANTAPIAGAVIATGVFVMTGENKTIQSLEGGVIKDIKVQEGDIVQPGQLLIQLDETGPRAELRRLVLKEARLRATEARLRAEMEQAEGVVFPPELLTTTDPEIRMLVRAQYMTFEARLKNVQNEIVTHQRSIDAIEEKEKGSQTQLGSTKQQITLIKEELVGKKSLLERGYIRKPEVLLLQRNLASLEGEVGRIGGDIGDARERISRTYQLIDGVHKTAIKAAVEQMHENGADLSDVRERILQARAILGRVQITAPVKGTVVKLRYHTEGGVIEPGKAIMEIVSLEDEMIIEARVRPQDINKIKHSQLAMIRLSALNQRTTPMVQGHVIYISADALPDDKRTMNGIDLYVLRVRLDKGATVHIPHFEPTPGMPAEVYVQTAERTFFEYLMQPLRDSMSRAFRET